MKQFKYQLVLYSLVIVFLMAGCTSKPEIVPASPTPKPLSTVSTPTFLPATATATPSAPKLELTYTIGSGVYEIEVGCLDAPQPCLGKPELLFMLEKHPIDFNSWSPDGIKLAYEHENNVFIADWNGKNATKISTSPSYSGWPVWMLNGQEIAYQTKGNEGYRLTFMMSDLTGHTQKIFTTAEELEKKGNFDAPSGLEWSPNGKNIVFQATKKNSMPSLSQIFYYDLETDQVKLISDTSTSSYTGSYTPSFSPDGQWIVFIREPQKYSSLSVDGDLLVKASAQTENESVIFSTAKDTKQRFRLPRWSPIGNWISIIMDNDVYIIRPDGTNLINVTKSSNIKENFANWRVVFP